MSVIYEGKRVREEKEEEEETAGQLRRLSVIGYLVRQQPICGGGVLKEHG
jgi:hypothetical protein